MEWTEVLVTLIRTSAAIAWTLVVVTITRAHAPVTPIARRLIGGVIVLGMWALAVGSLTQFGLLTDTMRHVYTAFTTVALLVAIVLLIERDDLTQ